MIVHAENESCGKGMDSVSSAEPWRFKRLIASMTLWQDTKSEEDELIECINRHAAVE